MRRVNGKGNGDPRKPVAAPLQLTRIERRKEKTRRALTDVALGLFYEKGIYWTKIEDITARADVGKGTFYLYFDTKEAILLSVLHRGLENLVERVREATAKENPGRGLVSAAIRSQLDFYSDHPEYLLLFHQVCGLLQLKTGDVKELKAAFDTFFNRLGRLIQPALNGKGRKTAAAWELGVALSAFTSSLLTHYLLFGKAQAPARWRAELQGEIERSIHALL